MAEYNTPPELLRASIESILAQTETGFELLIVDDGSRTDVSAIVDEYQDARIRVVGYGENRGFVAALNFGVGHARGEYIARMDTDDVAEPNYLASVVGWLRQHPEYSVASGRAREVSSDGRDLLLGRPGELTRKAVMRGFTPIHPATVLRASAMREVGGYREFRRSEDLALWCELLLQGHRLYMVPDVVLSYRVHDEDFSKRRLSNRGDEIRVRLHYYPLLGAGPREYWRIVRSIVSGLLPIGVLRTLRMRLHPRA
ncbi:glycosyltransferase [Microbacterium sp.]|jgi:glycosyltransferase involved in cell wall biosynthesis|uniref:glycosyltransferase n=1 Tax=Microbacterium sp. TaxID=51671 RepID=UPI0028529EC1|nr:glycosyltransferase [Microbacterium sp.]